MHFTILPALALTLSAVANAGFVVMYTCSSSKVVGDGHTVSALSIRVHYNNESDGCKHLFAFDAETRPLSPLLGFKKFCGDDGFCANIDIFPKAGLHISLDGKDVALGKPDTSQYYAGKTAATICRGMGISTDPQLSVQIWNNAKKTKCK